MTTVARTLGPWTLAITMLVSGAFAGRAQQPATDGAGVSALGETDPTIRREIEAARTRGVPVEPLLNKVREGRLKRASVPRIRTAVAALAVRLDSARSIFGPDATLEELTAGADALAAGAGAAELRVVTSAVTARPLTAPIGALAQLVASGVAPRHAAEMIVDLLRRKVGGAVVLAFGNLVESDAASGVPPEEAAAFRLHSLATGGIAALNASPSSAGVTSATQRPSPGNTTPRRRP